MRGAAAMLAGKQQVSSPLMPQSRSYRVFPAFALAFTGLGNLSCVGVFLKLGLNYFVVLDDGNN